MKFKLQRPPSLLPKRAVQTRVRKAGYALRKSPENWWEIVDPSTGRALWRFPLLIDAAAWTCAHPDSGFSRKYRVDDPDGDWFRNARLPLG